MSFLEKALELARKGFKVFPLIPDSKLPYINDYPNLATDDPERIKQWWTDPVMGTERDLNVGISTSAYGESEALFVIDVDNKEGKNGSEELEKLEMLEDLDFPETYTQQTPTGGKHLVYRVKEPVKQGSNVLGPGLDVRSRGGYIVAAGSVVGGKKYIGNAEVPHQAPKWVAARFKPVPPKTHKKGKGMALDPEVVRSRAIHYLENEAPYALQGEGGDYTTFKVAAKLKDMGCDEMTAADLMLGHWNENCVPPWDDEGLRAKVGNAYAYGQKEVGADAPELEFAPAIPDPQKPEQTKSYLETLNEKFAFVLMEGSHFILHETVDEKGAPKRVFLTEPTFKRLLSPFMVQTDSKRARTYAEVWLDWEGRRQYKGVCFAPGREPRNGYYNLWRGFTVEPLDPADANADQKRGFSMYMEHALENVCQGDYSLFEYLMAYFAHMIQKPYERPLTTLVFRGRMGTGKNVLVDRVGKLLGSSHYIVAQDSRYLTSNFNGHFDSCLMLVLDEAFWSGDKSAEGKLKGITTSPEIMIERKGKEPYMVDNLVRLVIIGNEEWLVPASADERRYAVFDVGAGKMQNRNFFHTMRVLMDEKGGSRLLLHYLKHFDLNRADINQIPKTDALLEQKERTLKPFGRFVYESLSEGKILNDFMDTWQVQVDKQHIRDAFQRYCKARGLPQGWELSDVAIGRELKKYMPSTRTDTKRRDGEKTVHTYTLPDLETARREWSDYIGHEVKWP